MTQGDGTLQYRALNPNDPNPIIPPSDELIPWPGRPMRSEVVRENFQVLRNASSLWAYYNVNQSLIPGESNTVYVSAGSFQLSGTETSTFDDDTLSPQLITIGGSAGQQLIALLVVETGITGPELKWYYGTWASFGNASPPAYPPSKLPICEVLVTYAQTEILTEHIKDVRPLVSVGGGSGGGGSLQDAYNVSGIIITDNGNPVQIATTAEQNVLNITKATTGSADAVTITNSGTGIGLNIIQDGARACAYFQKNETGSSNAVVIKNDGVGNGIDLVLNNSSTGLLVRKSNTGAGDCILINNSGIGRGIKIFQSSTLSATNEIAVDISSSATNSPLIALSSIAGNRRGDIAYGAARSSNPTAASPGDTWYRNSPGIEGLYLCYGLNLATDIVNLRSSLQSAYDFGNAISLTSSTRSVTMSQAFNGNTLNVQKQNTGSATCMGVLNEGSGEALVVTQRTTAGKAVRIFQQTNDDALRIEKSSVGAGPGILVFNSGSDPAVSIQNRGTYLGAHLVNSSVSGEAFLIDQDANNNAFRINKSHTGSSPVMWIDNAGTGPGAQISQNGNGIGITVVKTNTGNAATMYVDNSASAAAVDVINRNATSTASVLRIVNQSPVANSIEVNQNGATGIIVNQYSGVGINIKNSGTGAGVQIDQTGNGNGLIVTKSQTGSAAAVAIYSSASSGAMTIAQLGTNSGVALSIQQYATGDANAVHINTSTSSRHSLVIGHSGSNTAMYLGVNSAQAGLDISKSHTGVGDCIVVNNGGSGYDIRGTGNTWSVDKSGNASFASVANAAAGVIPTLVTLTWTNSSAAQSTGALGFTPKHAMALSVWTHPSDGRNHAMSVGFAIGTGVLARNVASNDHTDSDNVSDSYTGSGIGSAWGGSGQWTISGHQFVVQAWGPGGITIQPTITSTGVPTNANALMHLMIFG